MTAYRVYECPEGGGQVFCGEFARACDAVSHAETEPDGLPDYLWESARSAGSYDGFHAPNKHGTEDAEADSWHGFRGRFCVVRVCY